MHPDRMLNYEVNIVLRGADAPFEATKGFFEWLNFRRRATSYEANRETMAKFIRRSIEQQVDPLWFGGGIASRRLPRPARSILQPHAIGHFRRGGSFSTSRIQVMIGLRTTSGHVGLRTLWTIFGCGFFPPILRWL